MLDEKIWQQNEIYYNRERCNGHFHFKRCLNADKDGYFNDDTKTIWKCQSCRDFNLC